MPWVVEADIKGFFDPLSHTHRMRFLEHRISGSLPAADRAPLPEGRCQGRDQARNTLKQFLFGGEAGEIPIVGDWDGSGVDKVGVFRPGQSPNFFLGGQAGDLLNQFLFGGEAGEIPIVGKWS
jgi:hypothetical protein